MDIANDIMNVPEGTQAQQETDTQETASEQVNVQVEQESERKPAQEPENTQVLPQKEDTVDKSTETEENPETLNVDTSDLSDNTKLLLDVLYESKVDIQELLATAQSALEQRNEALLIPELFELKYGANAKIAMAAVKSMIKDTQNQADTILKQVHTLAGGEAEWQNLTRDFKAVADDVTLNGVRTLLNAKNFEVAVKLMKQVRDNSPKLPKDNGKLQGGSANVGAGFSAEEFQKALQELKKEANGRSLDTGVYGEKYKALVARRIVGKQSGR